MALCGSCGASLRADAQDCGECGAHDGGLDVVSAGPEPLLRPVLGRVMQIVRSVSPSVVGAALLVVVLVGAMVLVTGVLRHDMPRATASALRDPASTDVEAQRVLRAAATAQAAYFAHHRRYAAEAYQLAVDIPGDIELSVDTAGRSRYCMRASGFSSENTFTYDSAVGTVERGAHC